MYDIVEKSWKQVCNTEAYLFRTQPNIYDGAFLQNKLEAFSH